MIEPPATIVEKRWHVQKNQEQKLEETFESCLQVLPSMGGCEQRK